MAAIIEPRTLKGFRDFLPPQEIERRSLIEKIESSFRSFGFVPIDTPALEYAAILLGKGGGETEKQVYRFKDNGGRDVALRFDLTVPFARFVAQYKQDLVLPFRRYHIAKVWRGENTQRGRYREFTQCDIDIVGSNSVAADFEILLVIRNTFRALGLDVNIRLNHRGLFNRFLSHIKAAEQSVEILRIVDKLAKVGEEETRTALAEITGEGAERILEYINCRGTFGETLEALTELAGGPCPESGRLAALRSCMKDTGTEDSFVLDPSITRGLDYYTGIVYETFLNDDPSIGSVCSGGRYDNLAGLYSKDQISGVGTSIGLDRLIAALESLGKVEGRSGYTVLAITWGGDQEAGYRQALAEKFRAAGIPCETLLEENTGPGDKAAAGKALTRQFIQAEKKGIPWVLIPPEGGAAGFTLRDIRARHNREVSDIRELIKIVRPATGC
ncbi:MAG: histidine--tRNA ligase [Treponema sp.]|jgi:histidyl-tRNA synthetase|nr:histidine--tRNA ligase [Treponema sp.]